MTLPELCSWLNRLRAIPPDRVKDAIGRIHALGLSELPRQLRHPQSLDDVVRIVLLAEDIDALMERGVPTNKLVAKLRDVAQFETTSAEIRCCALLARRSDEDVGFELESGKSRGAHPDVRLLLPEGPPHSIIEIKAVGLSNAERTFMRRMSASLGLMTPRVGLANLHAGIDDAPPRFTTAQLRAIRDEAARWAFLDTRISTRPRGFNNRAARVRNALHPSRRPWCGEGGATNAVSRRVLDSNLRD
jgi:hypothetical protein